MPTKTTARPAARKNGAALVEADPIGAVAVQAMVTDITAQLDTTDTDAGEVLLSMAARILSATSPDQLTVSSKALHARDVLDVPIEVTDIGWQRSDYDEGGYDFYAVFHGAEVRTGEARVVTCGGATVVPAAYMLRKMGWLPTIVVFSEGKTTKAGYTPVNLDVVGDVLR